MTTLTVSKRSDAGGEFNPLRAVKQLWFQRDLIGQLTRREVAMRYRGTVLGMVWSFVTPLLMLAIYTFVYSVIFHATWPEAGQDRGTSRATFGLILFAGLIPYQLLAEVLTKSPLLIIGSPNYVKKVIFPLEILPVVTVLSATVHSVISLLILLAGMLIFRHEISMTLWMLPLVYVPLMLLSVGVGWFLSSLGMYIRDASQAIAPIVQMLAFLAPVFFPITLVPAAIRWVYYLNPLTMIVSGYRQTTVFDQSVSLMGWSLCTAVGLLAALAGYIWFEKTKSGFADVL